MLCSAPQQEVFLQPPNQRFTEGVKRQMFTLLRDAGASVGARVTGKEITGMCGGPRQACGLRPLLERHVGAWPPQQGTWLAST